VFYRYCRSACVLHVSLREGKVLEPKYIIASLLLVAVVVIVIAPSVDLEPTILRGLHVFDIVLLLGVAAAFVSVHASTLQTLIASRSLHAGHIISSATDLVVLVCARRC
jgi:hypothetical protein